MPQIVHHHAGGRKAGFVMREEGAAGMRARPHRRLFCVHPVLLQNMFYGATSFNQALAWNTASVTSMEVRAIA